MDRRWLDRQRMRRDGELGGRGSLGKHMTSAPAEGLPTWPGLRAPSLRRHSSPLFAKTLQELIAALWMLKGVSEQSFRLKIVGKKTKSNQNICLKSIITACGGFNTHLWFNIILAFRPKYIILFIFIAWRIKPSLLTCNYFMYGNISEIKLPHSHQQDSSHGKEVFPTSACHCETEPSWDYSSWSTCISPSRRKGRKEAKSGTV